MPQFKNEKKINETIIYILIGGIAMGAAAFCITAAMPMAPNAGYSKSISLLSVVLSTLYSVVVFKDSINRQKILGILGLIIGCLFVSF